MKTKFVVTYILPKDSDKKVLDVIIFQKEDGEKTWFSVDKSSSYCLDRDMTKNNFGENVFIPFDKAQEAYNLLKALNQFSKQSCPTV